MPPQCRHLVVVGASAGGASALPQILRRFGNLPTTSSASGMPVQPGVVHVAPPDHHLRVVEDQFVLSHGPTENGHRPAINALFRSAAVSMGPRVTGVLLSGVLDDGVAGLVATKAQGLPVAEIGALLAKLVRDNGVGRALWTAQRALDEKAAMAERMSRDATRPGSDRITERYRRMAEEAREAAELLSERLTAAPLRHMQETES